MNFKSLGKVKFPDSKLNNVNMMPFILNDPESIPPLLRDYWSMISVCNVESNRIGYLTVKESFLVPNQLQDREGTHIEKMSSRGETGIFMASTVGNSTEVWNTQFSHTNQAEISIPLGREYKVKEDELIWLTDKTPYRFIPVNKCVFRQFFKLVIDVDTWFALDSSLNPLGIKADCVISYENRIGPYKRVY